MFFGEGTQCHRLDTPAPAGAPPDASPIVLRLAAAAGHPVGDVRPPITTFESLGKQGRERVARMVPLMEELNTLVDDIEGRRPAAE